MRNWRNIKEVDFETFFGNQDIDVDNVPPIKHKWISFIKNFVLIFIISSLIGGFVSIPGLMAISASTQVAEPIVKIWNDIPSDIPEIVIAERNTLYDKNGKPFAEFWSENRVPVDSLDKISKYTKQGLIDTEDKTFYTNPGFDPKGTVRSAVSGRGGGSGITQQLVKNLLFYNMLGKDYKEKAVERSYSRKLKELKMALEYNKTHSKDEILLSYFNTVSFGSPNIYGIETASQYFFGKPAKSLTLAESSILVGTVQNPAIYNLKNPNTTKYWKYRQKIVLNRMLAEGHITQEEMTKALKQPIKFTMKSTGSGNCYSSKYPMYCKYVMDFLKTDERLGTTQLERDSVLLKGGLKIKTYLDPVALEKIEKTLKDGFKTTNRVVAPTALVEPGTGGVLAIAQNREWGTGKGKTTLITPNIPTGSGSVYKIFTLAAALNNGITEEQLEFSSQCPLNPGPNYDAPEGGFKNSQSCKLQGGKLDYKHATAYSSNTWFVTLEMKIGVNKVKEFSKSVGLSAPDWIGSRSLAYTLGTVGNSPIHMAAASATFSNRGVYCPPTPIISISYSDGTEPPVPDNYDPKKYACRAVMTPKNAAIVLKAMKSNVSGEIPNAFGIKAKIDGYDTAGKSGTNQELNSAWLQVSSNYSIFTNVYDMDKSIRGIDGVYYGGKYNRWYDNTAMQSSSTSFRKILQGTVNEPLQTNDTESQIIQIPVDETQFITVPSVLGMKPSDAVKTMQNLGIIVNVSKTYKKTPSGYPTGTIVEQSILPGEKLSKGTKKEIIIYIGK